MGFFKDFKEDASQAMKELMPQDDEVLDEEGTDEDDLVVNTLEDELDVESELSKLNGLLESVAKEETPVKEPAPETTQEKTTKAVTNKEAWMWRELPWSMAVEVMSVQQEFLWKEMQTKI